MLKYDPNTPEPSLCQLIIRGCIVVFGTAGAVYFLWGIYWIAALVVAIPVWILLADLFVFKQKSVSWYVLDFVRYLIVLTGVAWSVCFLWSIYWILGIIAACPIFIILLNLIGFLALPLYRYLTPEGRTAKKALDELKRNSKQ